jgi:hypothetical protein
MLILFKSVTTIFSYDASAKLLIGGFGFNLTDLYCDTSVVPQRPRLTSLVGVSQLLKFSLLK